MINKKIFLTLLIFSFFMILISVVKTQTRMIEKRIAVYEKDISSIKNNLHEAQLDFFYLSSPSYISKKIDEFSEEEYSTIKYSNIYLSLDQFLSQQSKTTKKFNNEKKNKEK